MKVEFNCHTDTSLGRAKIGTVLDLPTSEAKAFIASKIATKIGGKHEEFDLPVIVANEIVVINED